MRSSKLHDALRRQAFDLADRRGNNPHGTREAADHEGMRLNGYRYETVSQVERALDPRARRLGEANPPPASPSGGGGGSGGSGNGLLWLLAAGAGLALLSALSSSGESDDGSEHDEDDDAAPPSRENPVPAVAPSNITVNLTMPHAPAATMSAPLPNPAPSEPIHVTVPVMAPVVVPPPELPAAPASPPAEILANPGKKRRRSKASG